MNKRADILTLATHKGGVGKTSTLICLAGVLSEKEKVLLVDIDPQADLTESFDFGPYDRTLYDAMSDYKAGRKSPLPIYNISKNLDIIPASIELNNLNLLFASYPSSNTVLKRLLESVVDQYDWILIDPPGDLQLPATNAIIASDHVVAPITCDSYSIRALGRILGFVEICQDVNPRLSTLGILIVKYNKQRTVDNLVAEQIQETWPKLIFKTKISNSTAVSKAILSKDFITKLYRRTTVSNDFKELCKEVKQRVK